MPLRLYELLKTAKAMKTPARHVLFDSWFSNPVTLMTIKGIGYFCVSMLKKNKTKYHFQGENKTLSQIYKSVKKRPGRSKYLASVSVTLIHKDFEKPVPAVIVFVRDKSNKKKWCVLISTDTSLSEEKIDEQQRIVDEVQREFDKQDSIKETIADLRSKIDDVIEDALTKCGTTE